ncbi:cysteine hydrolase family protein [Roseateles saccharophilus]|uniref:Nicotinamidase-related amidase n=1 Tax=Roseateles saccharophilus TaxID=304 RepID=A0A4R3UI37_ROSSA|nr:isochorismatase family protein [Roseateles saccharophilus]MDG0835053.1 isochorismatase family protein [Roseateles saccharophilus]TCU88303.1 nicotinamidase-related amidase [Roseateles saccharophilus]
MTTALIVIDVQQSFAGRPYFEADGLPAYLAAQNRLIEGFEAAGLPIVRVFHVVPDASGTDPFSLASGQVRPLAGLRDFDAALTVHKSRHSALVASGLDVWLTRQGIRQLVISGIRTEQCCETTTRHASDLGWDVIYVPEATLTFTMQHPDGSPLTPAQLRARTAAVLAGRFARVMDTEAALRAVTDEEAALA